MLNRVRITNNVPIGSGETAGFVFKATTTAGVELKRPEVHISDTDGRRFIPLHGTVLKTAAYTILNREVGKTFVFNHATGFKLTLPTAASVPAGKIRVAVGITSGVGNHSVDIPATDTLVGYSLAGAAGDQYDLVGFVAGDFIEFESDGVSKWYISSIVSASITAGEIASNAVTTAKIADGAVTAAKVVATLAGVIATADGLTTGIIAAPTALRNFVAVTSAAAANGVSLPAAAAGTIGVEFWLTVGANGYELLTNAASNNTINAVDADGTNQLDVAANTTLRVTQVSATGFVAEQIAATTITVVAPDND